MEWPVGCPSGRNGSRLELVTFDSPGMPAGPIVGRRTLDVLGRAPPGCDGAAS